jgi:hypothetical protein
MSDSASCQSRKFTSKITLNAKGYPTVGMICPKSSLITYKNINILQNYDTINNVLSNDFTKKCNITDEIKSDGYNNKWTYNK